MSEPTSKPDNPRRWRLPDELPKDDDGELEGYVLGYPGCEDEPTLIGDLDYDAQDGWWFAYSGLLHVDVKCLAWRPVPPPDKPEWIK